MIPRCRRQAKAASALPQLRGTASVAGRQGMRTRRVMCPLLSQKVLLLARNGSSGAGWMLPSTSNARDVILCSPGAGVPQSNVQNLHAKPRDLLLRGGGPKSFAGIQGPSSIRTSTAAIGAPQAAPRCRTGFRDA